MLRNLLNTFLAISSIALLGVLFAPSYAKAQSLPNISINELNIQVHEELTGSARTYRDVSQNWFNYFTLENYSEVYNTDYVGVYEKVLNYTRESDIQALEDLRDTLSDTYGYTVMYDSGTHQTTIFAHLEDNTKSFVRNYCTPSACNHYLAFDKDVFRIVIRPQGSSTRPFNIVKTDLVSPTDTDLDRHTFAAIGRSGNYEGYRNIFFSNTEFDPSQSIAPWNNATEPPFNVDNIHEIEPEKIGVSIRGSVAEDVVQVEWYNDPTNPKPEDAEGMYLVLHNTNFDENPPECSNQNIQEWRHSLDEVAIFNPVPCYGMWYVQSYYTSDSEGQNIIPNTDKTSLNLRVDGGSFYFDYAEVEYEDDGTIISPPLAGVSMRDCVVFMESMPWIEFNYQGCFSNIQKFIGIASTNNANVSRQFENIAIPAHQGCGSLTRINQWIGLDSSNNYLCPQIPSQIRQYITLFAVFLLYIAMIFGWYKFITREY